MKTRQKQTLATKHPQTHLCLSALLRDTKRRKRRNKPRMRVVPRRPSASIQAHTQARLPFTQPTIFFFSTMQLSFKFQSRNLRGLVISLQKLSAGFVTHAASSRTSDRSRTCCQQARHSIPLFFLKVSYASYAYYRW